jgi:alpha-tubulin suppressor-like RCC1 family protein
LIFKCGDYHTLALKSDGRVMAWGDNSYGKLGDGTSTARRCPVYVKGVNNIGQLSDIVSIEAGNSTSFAIDANGDLYGFGLNNYGQTGDNTTTTTKSSPVKADISDVMLVSSGSSHTVVAKYDGTVWTWGYHGSRTIRRKQCSN